jgi:hypothetical protein
MTRKINDSYVDAINVFNSYFNNKAYDFKFKDNNYTLFISEDEFNNFIGYRKVKNSLKRSKSFCGLVNLLDSENYAVKIEDSKLAVFQIKEDHTAMIAIFEVNNDLIKLIDIDYFNNRLSKEHYINLIRRVIHAKSFVLDKEKEIQKVRRY